MKPLDEHVFFIDRCLGVEPLRTKLEESGLSVEIHDDYFSRDEEDRVWLKTIGERGWVILTKDQKLRYRPLEVAALKSSGARVFILTAGNLRGAEIAAVFLVARSRILHTLASQEGPFVAYVSRMGIVHIKRERASEPVRNSEALD